MLKKPMRWDIKSIYHFMIFFGLISTFFDLALIGTMLFIVKAGPELFRTAWFLESSVSEIIVTFAIRTKKPFYKSRPSGLLLVTSILAIAFSVILTYTALGAELFKFVEMPWEVLAMIAGILLTYFANSRSRKTLLLQSVQVIGLSSPLTRLLSHIPETKPSQRYSHRQHNIAHIYKGLCICRRLLWMPEQTHPNRQGRVYQRHSIRIRRRMPPLRCRGFRNMKQQPLRPGQADVPQSDTLFRRRAGPEETWLW